LQSVAKIGDQVVRVLEPDREPHQIGRDASCAQRGVIEGSGPHRGGMDCERLDPTEAHRLREQPQALHHPLGLAVAPAHLHGHHATEASHLPPRQRVLRMTGQTRIVDPLDARQALQSLGHPLRRGVDARDADPQRAQAAQQQPGVMGRERGPEHDGGVPDALDAVGIAHHDTRRQVVMTAKDLGGAVDDEVDAVLAGLLVEGAGEGVVGERDDPAGTGKRGHTGKIGECQRRVDRRLDDDQPGLRPDRRLDRRERGPVHEGGGHAEARQKIAQQARGAHVVVGLCHHVIAGTHQRQHGRGDRTHAACGHQRRGRRLEARQQPRHPLEGRIAVPGVVARMARPARHVGEVGSIGGAEGGRQMQRRRDGGLPGHVIAVLQPGVRMRGDGILGRHGRDDSRAVVPSGLSPRMAARSAAGRFASARAAS
jgi:hypothetical protein